MLQASWSLTASVCSGLVYQFRIGWQHLSLLITTNRTEPMFLPLTDALIPHNECLAHSGRLLLKQMSPSKRSAVVVLICRVLLRMRGGFGTYYMPWRSGTRRSLGSERGFWRQQVSRSLGTSKTLQDLCIITSFIQGGRGSIFPVPQHIYWLACLLSEVCTQFE